ncbi:unnamed protein product (mitochondrion) [Plasmodiophora brassicae]|uniref:G-protein coupled receptors family 1 profile domain-containing protein n=1 Tax=Plasmodiophora brassicae TaxID=37360 RepID=A0A3P3YG77_PLABS|nr:unnamed protein product [Plasmodiophora brassicae]
MAGTACAIVACGAALVAVCTGITVARTERATTILWTILGTSSITAVTKALVATQWLFRFTAADTILCAVVAQSVPFFYCVSVAFVLQFLHARALLVDEQSASSWLMRLIQLGILSCVPFGAVFGAVTETEIYISEEGGPCLTYYPFYIVALLFLAASFLTTLLIRKFTTAVHAHIQTMHAASHSAQLQSKYRSMAVKNMVASSIALSCTMTTLLYIVIEDLIAPRFEPVSTAIKNTICAFELSINLIVVCSCSLSWVPYELKQGFTKLASKIAMTSKPSDAINVVPASSAKQTPADTAPCSNLVDE